jgi:hypothetical protein
VPTQDRIRSEQCAELLKLFAAENLAFESESFPVWLMITIGIACLLLLGFLSFALCESRSIAETSRINDLNRQVSALLSQAEIEIGANNPKRAHSSCSTSFIAKGC